MQKVELANCDECPLKNNDYVPTEFNDSTIVLLLEAPGFEESARGIPAIGKAGQELDAVIRETGSARQDFVIMNCCCCHPIDYNNPNKNRTPTSTELSCCSERLKNELDQVCPSMVVALGQTASKALGYQFKGRLMKEVAGDEFVYNDRYKCIVTYHPSAISYAGGTSTPKGNEIRTIIRNAIKKAKKAKFMERQLNLI